MRLINKITNFINDEEFKVTVFYNRINIINYLEISEFNNSKITIKHKNGSVIINGNNLVVSRMLDDEVLITGNIKNIELR